MWPKAKLTIWLVVVPLAYLAGCDVADDLRVRNQYAVPIQLRYRCEDPVRHNLENRLLGEVPAGGERVFKNAASYKGGGLDHTSYETKSSKVLGNLRRSDERVLRRTISGWKAKSEWTVTVGP